MRRLVYSSIVSLDGYFEGPDGKFGWARPDDELHAHINDAQAAFDTYVFGRRMYEIMRFWDEVEPASLPPVEAGFARLWTTKRKLVASRTLTEVGPGAELIDGDLVAAVRTLKDDQGQDISVGGAGVARPLIEAGLVDVFTVWVLPVAVGGGKPFWPVGLGPQPLRLVDLTRFTGGAVALSYAPA